MTEVPENWYHDPNASYEGDGPRFIDPRTIPPEDVLWDDYPFLPRGELVTVNADGDTGKGLLSVHYAARMSRGEFEGERMVIFVTAEDRWNSVLVPRLLAAGADLDHIRLLGWRRRGTEDAMVIPDDVSTLEEAILDMAVRMVVIDPLLSHLSSKTSYSSDHEVKLALNPLVGMAHRAGCTVLGNGHFSKNRQSGARIASQGSTAFTNTPRVAWAMARDDEDDDVRVIEVTKSNIGPAGHARNLQIHAVPVAGLTMPVPVILPVGPSAKSVDELIRITSRSQFSGATIRKAVMKELEGGEWMPRAELNAALFSSLGASGDMVYRLGLVTLRDQGLVECQKQGFDGGWFWRVVTNGTTNFLSGSGDPGGSSPQANANLRDLQGFSEPPEKSSTDTGIYDSKPLWREDDSR